MSDTFQVNPQSAAPQGAPSTLGSVAPPQPERAQPHAPEASQPPQGGQPAAPGSDVAQDGQQPSPPPVDYSAQLEQERQARLRVEAEARQYRDAISQVQRYAEEQQANQAVQQQVQMMLATADGMSSADGSQYLQRQIANLLTQQQLTARQQMQQREQGWEQERKQIAAPLYADHLIQEMGLPAEAKAELLNLRDPDLMYQQAPAIKQRYDAWEQQRKTWEQQNQQFARSQEAGVLRQNGLGAVGGQGAGGVYEIEVSDDPDIRAMQVLAAQRKLERQGTL